VGTIPDKADNSPITSHVGKLLKEVVFIKYEEVIFFPTSIASGAWISEYIAFQFAQISK